MFYGKPSVFDSVEMTIDIVQNGAVATGDVYPQPFKTGVLWDAYLIKAIHWQDSQETLLYFSTAIQKTIKEKFNYDKKATWERVKEESVWLPINESGNIDLAYIKEQIRELEGERMSELEAYLESEGFEDCSLSYEENKALLRMRYAEDSVKLFKIDELFNVATGRDVIISRTREGDTPLISHQHDNNGISKYVDAIQGRRLFSHEATLPLADRGVFLATTQAEDFYIGTRVKALTFKSGKQTEDIRLFFVAAINKLQILFTDYLTNATDDLPNLKISLPITHDGSIDYSYMELVIKAIKKQCIAILKKEIEHERQFHENVFEDQSDSAQIIDINVSDSKYSEGGFETLMAAEPFERYKWAGFDQSIIDFFGNNQTILIGCYKSKKHHDWIHANNIYNIRLGKTKGSMEATRELFDSTSLLILYELGKPNKLSAYKITGHHEITKDELIKLGYPNKKPRKSYMAFDIAPVEKDLTFLVEHHLIERLVELDANNAKGTPVFIVP